MISNHQNEYEHDENNKDVNRKWMKISKWNTHMYHYPWYWYAVTNGLSWKCYICISCVP